MRRLTRKAILLFAAYVALLLAVGIAGFIGHAIGIWASVLWGLAVIACVVVYGRRRARRPQVGRSSA